MMYFGNIHFTLFIASVFATSVSTSDKSPCPIAEKCTTDPPLAWATDGRNCLVFQNECQLRNQICQRQNNNDPTFTVVERDECFKYCRYRCSRELDPVCTMHENSFKTFPNTCLWSQEMCQNEKAYVFQFAGSCEPDQ